MQSSTGTLWRKLVQTFVRSSLLSKLISMWYLWNLYHFSVFSGDLLLISKWVIDSCIAWHLPRTFLRLIVVKQSKLPLTFLSPSFVACYNDQITLKTYIYLCHNMQKIFFRTTPWYGNSWLKSFNRPWYYILRTGQRYINVRVYVGSPVITGP